jgi:hypothetical protein
MGNRAVITTPDKKIGVYLHWNGGRNSVEAFLKYCELQGFRKPENDNYGWSRMCQVIANYFDGDSHGLCIGIDRYEVLDTDNWDNGVYIIKNWQIVEREFMRWPEQTSESSLLERLIQIDECQPVKMQLGAERIAAMLNN